MTKKYLASMCSANEYAPLEFIYVELTEDLRSFITKIIESNRELMRRGDFSHIAFIDYSPTFLEAAPRGLDEDSDLVLSDCDPVELPDDTKPPESDTRIDYALIQIDEDGFLWTARVKHTSMESESSKFYYNQIGWPELKVERK